VFRLSFYGWIRTILSAVEGHPNSLIVMGVARPAREQLFFGEIATSVFEKTPASILLIST